MLVISLYTSVGKVKITKCNREVSEERPNGYTSDGNGCQDTFIGSKSLSVNKSRVPSVKKGATDIEEIQSLSINNCFPSQGIGLDWYIIATASMCLSEKNTPCLARDLRSKTTQLVTNLRLLEGITVFDLQGPPKAIEQELIFTSLDLEEVLRWMTMTFVRLHCRKQNWIE